jgi:hypothetical protein
VLQCGRGTLALAAVVQGEERECQGRCRGAAVRVRHTLLLQL